MVKFTESSAIPIHPEIQGFIGIEFAHPWVNLNFANCNYLAPEKDLENTP